MASLEENIKQAIADFDSIKDAIEEKGVEVPKGTDTKEYGNLIRAISGGGESPSGSVEIKENGEHDVAKYATAIVDVPIPENEGSIEITENGTHIVDGYVEAVVNVPIPEGYIKPSGSIEITENGTHDVKDYAEAVVNVPIPEGDSYYDTFWDAFQQNGERTNYENAFKGGWWSHNSFKPKYPLKPSNAYYMMEGSKISGDLRELCELDTSNCTNFSSTFANMDYLTAVGVIDARATSKLNYIFNMCKLQEVELIKIKDDGSTTFSYSFYYCVNLKEIRFEGVIGKAIDFKNSPLSVTSMKNIIEHLKNFNGTGSENTQKLTFSDACWEALEADSTAPDGGTWKEYVQFTLCWNV